MLRFYKGAISIDDVRAMTPMQFGDWVHEMNVILELENPEEKRAITGDAIHAAVMADPAVRKL